MSGNKRIDAQPDAVNEEVAGADLLGPLVLGNVSSHSAPGLPSLLIGELIAFKDQGRVPLITLPGQDESLPIMARATVDLHGGHIGKSVAVMFDGGDRTRPIVIGVVRGGEGWPMEQKPAHVEVDVDGERMIVSAKRQLVLRCGLASMTLSADGKVVIRGTSVVSQAEHVNRIRGGSVQIN